MPELLLRGNPIGDIKGVLFDKDGTLSKSEEHLLQLAQLRVNEGAKLFIKMNRSGHEVKKLEDFLSSVYGLTSHGLSPNGSIAIASREHNLISTASVLCLLGVDWSKAVAMAHEIFQLVDRATYKEPIKRTLLPGVQNLLQNLKEAGVKCAMISNDTREGIINFLETNDVTNDIYGLWSADNQPTKPNPGAVLELCKIIQLQPSECALVGDADTDLKMARQAGIGIALGYSGGWTKPPRLTEHHHLIHHWDELNLQPKPKVHNKIGVL